MRYRFGLVLALLTSLSLPGMPALAQSACQLTGGFAELQSQIPDHVGTCNRGEIDRIELGEATQPTTNGRLVYHSVDGVVSFSDGTHSWVLDPNGQAQVRGVNERFPWEFNGDGLPLVGQPGPQSNGPCPSAPVQVLAVENFYANLVNQIGGQYVQTTTISADPDADPHEFYPAASDVVGLHVGANPHVWYSAGYVDQIRAAILGNLKQLNPQASAYYDAQSVALDQEFSTYHSLIDQIASKYANVPVGATESIFVDMAYTAGLDLISPPEFMRAVAEGNDPTARDVASFQNQITNHQIKVLVYNTQTVTSLTEQLKAMAQQNNIPIVGVSETMPLGAQTFQGWQSNELELLLQALQKATGTS